MQLILITRSDKPHVSIRLMGWRLWVALGIIAAVILLAMRIGMAINTESGSLTKSVIDWWEETREDSLAKELGGLKAKVDMLESTVSVIEGEDILTILRGINKDEFMANIDDLSTMPIIEVNVI